jgi:voltage-gated potassium channel
MTVKQRVWQILEVADTRDRACRIFGIFIMSLIVLNVVASVFETMEVVRAQFHQQARLFELFSVSIFTIEYAARMWSCTASPRFARPVMGRLRFAVQPMTLVDLAVIAPFLAGLVTLAITSHRLRFDTRTIRLLRLLRLFRILKLARYTQAIGTIGAVIREKREELIVLGGLLAAITVVGSSLMFMAEHDAQPDKFSSVPATMWWTIVTLATVGYGDMYPVTAAGKTLASALAIVGIGMFALPAGILGSAFVEEMRKKRMPRNCPHCGKELPP